MDRLKSLLGTGAERLSQATNQTVLSQGNDIHCLSSVSKIVAPERHQALPTTFLNNRIISSLKPDIEDSDILTPVNYYNLLKGIREKVRRSIERSENADTEDVLRDLLDVLDYTKADFDLLEIYRNALVKS